MTNERRGMPARESRGPLCKMFNVGCTGSEHKYIGCLYGGIHPIISSIRI